MKNKIIGILVCMLLIATAVPAVTSLNDNGITPTGINSTIQSSKQITHPLMARGNVIFSQPPHQPSDPWSAFTSASSFPYLCQEDFWGLTDPIDDIHWWGLTLIWDDGWYIGHPDGMVFEIKFYQDSGGAPGAVVATYSNIAPTYTDTGVSYAGYELYYFETNIPSVSLATGWISIQSTYSPDNSVFLWITSPDGNLNALQNGGPLSSNLAFELTHIANPDLTCTGLLGWTKVKPGATVTGSFQVGNAGAAGSLLNWRVDSWPSWGNWTFTPNSGTGLAEGDAVTITLQVVAPPEKKTNFTGKVKVINSDNISDFCEINVYLKTPLNQGLPSQSFLARLFERFPHAFPILRQLMGY